MGKRKTKEMVLVQPQSSLFKKTEITSISDILNIYLFFELTQEVVNTISQQSGLFLHHFKEIDATLIEENFNLTFTSNKDKTLINVYGINLLSSLWIIGIYPDKPETLVGKEVYQNGDFIYRFYTENKNLSITKTIPDEGKPTGDPRDRKVSKRTQRKG
jgi:hypothetical protein